MTREGEAAERAFTALVERHGPALLRICRALLRNEHDAEDAFQATFLVLARKAPGLRVRESLGPWINAVGRRVAARAKEEAGGRRNRELRAAERAKSQSEHGVDYDDLRAVLYEELNRLPDKYRIPIELCDLAGETHEDVARRLSWPVGTVKSRHSRGRLRLRARLSRRGFAGFFGIPTAAFHDLSLPVPIRGPLVEGTAVAAVRFVLGRTTGGVVPTSVFALATESLRSMFVTRLTMIIGILLTMGVGGVAVLALRGPWSALASATRANEPAPQEAENGEQDPQEQAAQEEKVVLTNPMPRFADSKSQNAGRIELMKKTAASIEIRAKGNGGTKLALGAEPVMRWDNDQSRVVDASAFIWFDEHRPQVIGGIWIKDGRAYFELQSLSSGPLIASVGGIPKWSTSRPGISWEAVPGAPPPAASRGERLRQMKRLARDFGVYAVKTPPDYAEGSVWHLRMLVQPIHRYADGAAVDGAIFAFAQGTDPEAYLILESRPANGTSRWHFGIASACVWELHARHGVHEVWFRPKWNHQDADPVYGLVGLFPVDRTLLPSEPIKPRPAP